MPSGAHLSQNTCSMEPDGIGVIGLLDFIHSPKLFLLTFPFGCVNVGEKSLVSFLIFSFKATNSSSEKSGAALDSLTNNSAVVVAIEVTAACLTSELL